MEVVDASKGRVDNVHYDVAVTTSTRDHLDTTATWDSYGAGKARLFPAGGLRAAVVTWR